MANVNLVNNFSYFMKVVKPGEYDSEKFIALKALDVIITVTIFNHSESGRDRGGDCMKN